jgi:aryl-alcohol dehydrogenase-like predicted oxidoreductase
LAAGLLTGKYQRGQVPSEGRWKDGKGPGQRRLVDASYDVSERVVEIARRKDCTPGQLALAWCMHQPGITSPIIGPRTMDQLVDNLGALKVTIGDEDRQSLDEVSPPGGVISKYYEADFGPHEFGAR